MSPNDADGMANSVDPNQTAPLGAVWSGSALFAQAYLSEKLGSLRYVTFMKQYSRQIFTFSILFHSSRPWEKLNSLSLSRLNAFLSMNGMCCNRDWNDRANVLLMHCNACSIAIIALAKWAYCQNYQYSRKH